MSTIVPAAAGFCFLELFDEGVESFFRRTPIVAWRVKEEDEETGQENHTAEPITTIKIDGPDVYQTAFEAPDGKVYPRYLGDDPYDSADEFLANHVRWAERKLEEKALPA